MMKKTFTRLSLTNFLNDKATIITYGGLTELVMDYAFDYYLETEVSLRIISLAKLSPMNIKNLKSLKGTNILLVLEESDGKYGLSSEIISNLSEEKKIVKILISVGSRQKKVLYPPH